MRAAFRIGLAWAIGAALTAAAAHAETAPVGRLSDAAIPTAYRLDLTLLPDQDRFRGHVEIEVTLKAPAKTIWIHGRGLSVRNVSAKGATTVPASYHQVNALGLARIDFASTLPAGRETIEIDYDAALGPGPGGAYHAKVADRWYAWSHFESIDARSAFPCFDQPGFKTPLVLTVTTASGDTVIANAPEIGSEPVGGLVRHRFARTEPLPTYLMAFYVGPFATASMPVKPTPERPTALPVRVVATQPNAGRLTFPLQNTAPILALLESYFGSPFPFAKLDQVASPLVQGGMENAGADLYGDQFLLVDDASSTGSKQIFGEVVAHELSHQWFGDLVTPAWWDDVWLNESFANWMGFRIGDAWRPELGIRANAVADAFTAMDTDALLAGRAIHQPIATSGDIADTFDEITYGKGAQVVGMIASFLGDDTFRDGVRLHLKRHAYASATTDQFFQSLADVAHDPRIVPSMKSFVDQQGVPVVDVARVPGGLSLTQRPYALLGTVPPQRSWIIPACLSVDGRRECAMLGQAPTVLAGPAAGAIMPNAGGQGYYRFSFDAEEWNRLIAAAGALAPGEALATTDSLWAAFRAGELSSSMLFAEARSISHNPYADAAIGPGRRLAGLRKSGFIPTEQRPAFRRFLLETYAPLLAPLGFDPRGAVYEAEETSRRQLRSQLVSLIAFEGGDPALRATLGHAASAYLAGDRSALDPSYVSAGLRARVEDGRLEDAESVFEAALSSSDGSFRSQAMGALVASGRMDVARWIESRFADPRFQPTERLTFILGLFDDPATRDLGLTLVLEHFDELAKNAPAFVSDGLLSAPGRFCTTESAEESWSRLEPLAKRDDIGLLPLRRAVERARSCAALKSAKAGEFASGLP